MNKMEEETKAAAKKQLSDEGLADVSGGRQSVWNQKKSKHKCPFCGQLSDFEDSDWDQIAPTRSVRCSKCRGSYPKFRWDPMAAEI